MSAREDLIKTLRTLGADPSAISVFADGILDQHAHELAEEIRQETEAAIGQHDRFNGMNDAANLIDPDAA